MTSWDNPMIAWVPMKSWYMRQKGLKKGEKKVDQSRAIVVTLSKYRHEIGKSRFKDD